MENYAVWNAEPVLFRLGTLSIHWYGILFATALGLGFAVMRLIYRQEKRNEKELDSLLIYLTAGTLIGARLGHVLFYDPALYLSHPWETFAIWKGGLASHGGALGIVVSLWLYCRRHPGTGYIWLLDRITVPALLGGGLIRIGNFFNSEIVGVSTIVPWAIVFPHIDLLPRHPTQLYESAVYMVLFAIFCTLYRTSLIILRPGMMAGCFLILVCSARFILEFTKMPQAAYESSLLSVGQWLSIPPILFGIALSYRATTHSKTCPVHPV
ncbi:prolipoprotein diacylglyceryl transferase [Pseudomonas sp. BP8]|uniref:prolipoprotein diacylglyceryl transferase n=1 Tax=Pseudomonas sp. BP8 TaxID=2817864 RepID=UPI001AE36BDB|nr:prolipoprotein diacylglyceryl transferase [Pseudomonas sp. BP8]MBP2261604.1 prolipoprotein diacylglyceryl transferase [Pseudomonas sp. BP8]HDS1733511.1 prolipoprotein diacylglyceryl transferase [Pseudomonas putida]